MNEQIAWLFSRCEPQHDFETGEPIPGSGYFQGRLPSQMISQIWAWLKETDAWFLDACSQVTFSWKIDKVKYHIRFGAYQSTANDVWFGFIPSTW